MPVEIRSPYSVIDSYKTLGWGIEAGGTKSDFERITEQNDLFKDFPLIKDIFNSIDKNDYISKIAFQWCTFYRVPLDQLDSAKYLLIHYEDLLLKPKETLSTIFEYTNIKGDISLVLQKIKNPSGTNYRNIDFDMDKDQLIEKWKNSLSSMVIDKINNIIKMFKLDHLYNKDGYPLKN